MSGVYNSVLREGLFAGQTIIVTGGGSGIGRCIAHEISALGARTIILGRRAEKLQHVAAEIVDDGGLVDHGVCDIRDDAQVQQVVSEMMARYGRIDGLVNNAGGQFPAALEDISRNGFEAVVRTNLVGGFLVSREVFRQSMKRHGGAIVNITADCGNGMPRMAHSGAARAGMENLTRTAAWEWGPYGVRVNAVAPGFVESSGFDTYEDPATMNMIVRAGENVPLKRLGAEAEVSAAVCFLLSEGAEYINGAILPVDGGSRLCSAAIYQPLPEAAANPSSTLDGFHRRVVPDLVAGRRG